MTLSPRVATGIPLLVLGVVVDFLPQALFSACIGMVVLLGAREWARLGGMGSIAGQGAYAAVVAACGGAAWYWEAGAALPLATLATVFWASGFAAIVATQRGVFDLARWPRLRLACGLPVLVPAWSALAHLHLGPGGPFQVLFLLVLIWTADIAAYFVGRRWGRRRLCPAVSPGKSVEGALAGIGAAILLGLLLALWQNLPAPAVLRFAMLAAGVAAVSIVGDLFESMVKRSANVKDSGSLLPGHGGVLDRVDSLTAAAPVYVLGLQLAGVAP